jgi:hypothetical protein
MAAHPKAVRQNNFVSDSRGCRPITLRISFRYRPGISAAGITLAITGP